MDSAYCRHCGARISTATPPPQGSPRRLTRLPPEGKLGGVCAGIAAYLNIDVALVRLLWVILSIVPGAIIGGVVAYVIAWLLMPEAGAGERPVITGRRLIRSATDRRIAGVLGGVADYFGVDSTAVRVVFVVLSIYPGAIVAGVIAYGIGWIVIPPAPEVPLQPASAPV